MPYLLDTHTLLWFLNDDPKLSSKAKKIIEGDSVIYVSYVSLWEISVKANIGKLNLAYPISRIIEELNELDIHVIQVTSDDLEIYISLPLHHRDPFDRLLISQTINHKFDLITKDDKMALYEISCIW